MLEECAQYVPTEEERLEVDEELDRYYTQIDILEKGIAEYEASLVTEPCVKVDDRLTKKEELAHYCRQMNELDGGVLNPIQELLKMIGAPIDSFAIYQKTGKTLCKYPGFERRSEDAPTFPSRQLKEFLYAVYSMPLASKDIHLSNPSHQEPMREAWWEGWKQDSLDSPPFLAPSKVISFSKPPPQATTQVAWWEG